MRSSIAAARKRLLGLALAATLLAVVAAGCGDDAGSGGAASASDGSRGKRKVDVRLNVTATTYHAGFYVAKDKGYYEDEGLEIKLHEGTGSTPTAQQVAAGSDDFGFTSADGVLRVADAGGKLKMIANVLPDAGFCLLVPEDSGIQEPKDMEGHSVGDAAGFITLQMLPALWDAAGVDGSKVKVVNVDPADRLRAWTSGAFDGLSSIFVEPITAEVVEGRKSKCFEFSDYGIELLGYGIVANEKTLKDPDLMRRFLRATLKGYQDAYADPEMGADTTMRIGGASVTVQKGIEKLAPATLVRMAELYKGAAPEGEAFGYMEPERWEAHAAIMRKHADLGDDFELEDFYTNEFLEGEG